MEVPVTPMASNTNYAEMSNAELDSAITDANGLPTASQSTEVGTPTEVEPVVPDGLHPSEAPRELTVEDYAEPMKDFEVDNLNYSLAETPQGVDVLIAFNKEGLTDNVVAMAKAVGVSNRQIEEYKSHIIHTANKVYADAGLSFNDGVSLVKQAQSKFSQQEMKIFTDLADKEPVKAIESLVYYFNKEK